MANGKRSQSNTIEAIERRREAVNLRMSGMALRDIVTTLQTATDKRPAYKCSLTTIHRDIQAAISDLRLANIEQASEMAAMQKLRFDFLRQANIPEAAQAPVSKRIFELDNGKRTLIEETVDYRAKTEAGKLLLAVDKQEAALFGLTATDRSKLHTSETYALLEQLLIEVLAEVLPEQRQRFEDEYHKRRLLLLSGKQPASRPDGADGETIEGELVAPGSHPGD